MIQTALRDNYYALCICVLTERIPEEAFIDMNLMSGKKIKLRTQAAVNNLSDQAPDEVREMIALRRTHTWKEIGKMFGISDQAAYQRVKKYSKRKVMSG